MYHLRGTSTLTFLANKLTCYFMLKLFKAFCVFFNMEQDEEREAFFSQLLVIAKRNNNKCTVSETDGDRSVSKGYGLCGLDHLYFIILLQTAINYDYAGNLP